MSSVQNMTSGSPGKLILKFAFPLMLGNLFQQFYTIADTAIVGQFLGVEAIAAVGAAEWTIWMMQGTIQGLTQGFSIEMAKEFGAGDHQKLRRAVSNSVFLSLGIALIMLFIGQLFGPFVLNLLHTPDSIFPDAKAYLLTMFWGIPVVMAYNLLAAILRSLGDGKTPLYAMVFASVLTIILDILFVTVLHFGVVGAAIATVIAQFFSCIYCVIKICRIDILRFSRQDLVPNPRLQLTLIRLGLPMAFQFTVISVGGMLVQSVVNSYGVIFIAGFTATNKMFGLLDTAAVSYGYAMTTYTGQNLGAGKTHRIRTGYRTALLIALISSLAVGLFMILAGRMILGLFISGDAKTVADTLDVAYHYLFLLSVCLPLLYYLHVTRSCTQGMGNTLLPMCSGFMEFIMRVIAVATLPGLLGPEGIFLAEIAAWTGADVFLFFSYRHCLRKLSSTSQSDT